MQTTSKIYAKLGQRIKQIRLDADLSQEKLAYAAGITRTFIGSIERGEKRASLETLEQIAKVLKVELYQLLQFDEP